MQGGRWQEPMSCAGSDLRSEPPASGFCLQPRQGKRGTRPWVRHVVLPVAFGSSMGHGLWSTPLWIGLRAELHPTRSCHHGGVVEDTGTVQLPSRCFWAFHGSTRFALAGCCLNIDLQKNLFPGQLMPAHVSACRGFRLWPRSRALASVGVILI